jgi:uncharacterized protein (DUF302 family)
MNIISNNLVVNAVFLVFFLMSSALVQAAESVYVAEKKADFEVTYKKVYASLEASRFYVVFEPDIGNNLAGFANKWQDYNLNKLDHIKSMVFCNGWYANQVSNADPDMLALCPLHLTVTHKNGITRVLFVRPDYVAKGTKAEAIAKSLTADVINAINESLK